MSKEGNDSALIPAIFYANIKLVCDLGGHCKADCPYRKGFFRPGRVRLSIPFRRKVTTQTKAEAISRSLSTGEDVAREQARKCFMDIGPKFNLNEVNSKDARKVIQEVLHGDSCPVRTDQVTISIDPYE